MYLETTLPFPTYEDPDLSDSLSVYATMDDGSNLKTWLSIDSEKLYAFTESKYDIGFYKVLLIVVDDNSQGSKNGKLADTVIFSVEVVATNRPPYFSQDPEELEITLHESYLLAFSFGDDDTDDTLTFEVIY